MAFRRSGVFAVFSRWCSLLLCFVAPLLCFLAAKVAFMVSEGNGQELTAGDYADVLWHGLTLDLSTSLYLFIVPFLLLLVSCWWKGRLLAVVWHIYAAAVSVLLGLCFVADTSLYRFWQFKLDASCLDYLHQPTEAMASVTTGYLLLRLLWWVLASAAVYAVFRLLGRPFARHLASTGQPSTWKRRMAGTLCWLACVPFIIIGIRGGTGESTTNIGQVYFSQRQFLNHSAVNPMFSFLASIGKSGDYIIEYDFMSPSETCRLTAPLFDTRSIQPDTLLNSRRPDILLIVVESCGGQFTWIGGRHDITPRLNRLADSAVCFDACYANSWRTDKGLVSILSGYPAFPVTSLMKLPEKSRRLPSIARSLRNEGYATAFFYGGDVNYSNMRSYIIGTGYEEIVWQADFPLNQQHAAKWGVSDDLMFNTLLDSIRSEEHQARSGPRRPWMKTLLTLLKHEPWDVPTHNLDDPVANAFNFTDLCIGRFIDSLRQMPLWNNLLVVVLPDHGYRYQDINESSRLYNHVPLLWTGGAVRVPRHVTPVCNQSDLAATLLAQLGLDHGDFAFSRDVLSANYSRPLAWHTFNNGYTVFDSTAFAAFDLEANRLIAAEGDHTDSLLRIGQALLQLTSHSLKGHE